MLFYPKCICSRNLFEGKEKSPSMIITIDQRFELKSTLMTVKITVVHRFKLKSVFTC